VKLEEADELTELLADACLPLPRPLATASSLPVIIIKNNIL
jgi:hypothetical protein